MEELQEEVDSPASGSFTESESGRKRKRDSDQDEIDQEADEVSMKNSLEILHSSDHFLGIGLSQNLQIEIENSL